MSLRKNAIANYACQGYTILISIVMLPLYLKYLGPEAFGLVGFFAMMHAWFAILDMGLTPTLSRQAAHERGKGEQGLGELGKLLRSVEAILALLVPLFILGIWVASDWIATQWLMPQVLSAAEVAYCIFLMGVMIGLQWFASVYRGGIQGMERMVWLSGANIVLATLRFALSYILLRWVTQGPRHFFEVQLAVSVVELGILAAKFHGLLPTRNIAGEQRMSWSALKSVLPFAGGVAYTAALWVLLTQTDKLILSHVLTLQEYGHFTLVGVVAGGLLSLSGPLSQTILPRMTLMLSQGDEASMLSLYRRATQLTVATIFPIASTVAMFSSELLYAWTGDQDAANWAGPVLTWFALGNGILAVSAFQYYLQYAHGKMRLHVANSTINALLQIPILAYAAFNYGALGEAYAWFGIRLVAFFVWTAVVHSRFAPGLHVSWLVQDIAPGLLMTLGCLMVAGVAHEFFPVDRMSLAITLVGVGLFALVANLVGSSAFRSLFRRQWKTF